MASGSPVWFDERRTLGILAALAAAVVSVMTLFDLDDVDVRDVVGLIATVSSYLVYAGVARCPAWPPFAVSCVAVAALNVPEVRTEGSMFFIVLALAHLALEESQRLIVVVCGLGAVIALTIVAMFDGRDVSWHYWLVGVGFGWGIGELGYRFRLARDALATARARVTDHAALEERQRIARDVHDLLGHSLTIVLLQLTAARHLLRRDPDEADAALADAERVGRDSLHQVRLTVGLLRPPAVGAAHEAVGPSPTLEDLEDLLADYRSAGIAVWAEVDGPVAALDAARSVAGYRIVQEAMTNVAKHSPSAETSVTVEVDASGSSCRIVVASRGGSDTAHGSTSGFGLSGMRERASSVGGTVDAGPVEDGWRVSADLPPLSDGTGAGT